MKYSLILIALLSFSAFAQDWQVVQSNKTYFYQHSDSSLISNTIHVDSTNAIGIDSTYFLSTTTRLCDTCTVFPNGSSFNVLYHGYVKDFLGYELDYDANNKTASYNGNMLQLNANLLDTWLFNPLVTAQITDLSDSLLFGSIDSVKTIVLNSTDTILLSKNNGIIQYPDFNGNGNLHLTGFHQDQNSVGEYLPNFWSTYDFSVGDKFSFENYHLVLWNEINYDITIEILEDLSQGSEKKFVYKLLGKAYHGNGVNDPPTATYYTDYHNITDTMSISFNQNMFENHFSNISSFAPMTTHPTLYSFPFASTFSIAYQPDTTYQLTFTELDPTFGYSTRSFLAKDYGDSLYYIDNWTNLETSFANDFGRTFQYIFDFEFAHQDELVGAITDGDTVGTVFDFPEDLGKSELKQNQLQVFPNPTNGKLFFYEQLNSARIYNVSGQLVYNETDVSNVMNISHLERGLYILIAEKDDGSFVSTRILKE